jgi:hypothetical protein
MQLANYVGCAVICRPTKCKSRHCQLKVGCALMSRRAANSSRVRKWDDFVAKVFLHHLSQNLRAIDAAFEKPCGGTPKHALKSQATSVALVKARRPVYSTSRTSWRENYDGAIRDFCNKIGQKRKSRLTHREGNLWRVLNLRSLSVCRLFAHQ